MAGTNLSKNLENLISVTVPLETASVNGKLKSNRKNNDPKNNYSNSSGNNNNNGNNE